LIQSDRYKISFYKQAYWAHKQGAKSRNIEFLLTFEEWLQIWQDSGQLENRGRGSSEYCMARFGDKGPYAIGNVKIITNAENISEGHWKKMSESHKKALLIANKKPKSIEHRKKLSDFHKTNELAKENLRKIQQSKIGKPVTLEARRNLSKGQLKRIAREKELGIGKWVGGKFNIYGRSN
jgi:hypothetical protein